MSAIVWVKCPCSILLGFHSEMVPEGEFAIWDPELPEVVIADLIGAKITCNKCGRITLLQARIELEAMVVRGVSDE